MRPYGLLDKLAQRTRYRSYRAEPKSPTGKRNWKGVSPQKNRAVEANRRRMKRAKGKGSESAKRAR